jgi:predicted cupin superfamily sugar epimerase
MSVEAVIRKLEQQPHPVGGWSRETWVGPDVEGRSPGTAILFLLRAGERSLGRRLDAAG